MDIKDMNDREIIRCYAQQKQVYKDSYGALKDLEEEMNRRYKQDLKRVADSNGQTTLSELEG